MRQINSSFTALSPVSVPLLTTLSQYKQITQCAHKDDMGGENSLGRPHGFLKAWRHRLTA